jgi:amphi-Trp domain-containing protein
MGIDTFEYAKIAPPGEIAEYLTSLALGLRHGEVRLEPGDETLDVGPATRLTVEVRAKERDKGGKLRLELGWRQDARTRATELRVNASSEPSATEGRSRTLPGPRTMPEPKTRGGAS